MTLPPLVAAMLFWGWQTGSWWIAAIAAAALGAAPFLPLRWTFSSAELIRVSDFCSVLVALLGVYFMVTYGSSRGVAMLFQWLPIALLPVALAHAYGGGGRMDASVFFWSMRRRPPLRPVRFDPSFPYFAVWILGASAANMRDDSFYAGIALLAAWPLVARRPLAYPVGTWAAAFSFAVAIGYGAQYGLHELQAWLESAVPDWMVGNGTRTNPYRSMTDIGHIGELKQSDAIVLRVEAGGTLAAPLLLHRASYNNYAGASWLASFAPFDDMARGTQRGSWTLAADREAAARIVVRDYTAQSDPVLSLPSGTAAIEGLEARRARVNPLGAVQIERDPGYFSYAAAVSPAAVFESPPAEVDLRIGRAERDAFERLATELALAGQPPAAILRQVQDHFRERYRYSAFLEKPAAGSPAIVDFIRRTRSGHCEYFATATVLLLRAAGIPARYATGFSVQEYSGFERAYVVRERHAHAWAHAWVNGAWIAVDTTPPDWFAVEAESAPLGAGLRDAWSWARYRLADAWSVRQEHALTAALLVALPFALWLAFRLYRSRRTLRPQALAAGAEQLMRPGADSEFYLVEKRLSVAGRQRRAHETPGDWLERLVEGGIAEPELLATVVQLHYRYRFDPRGLAPGDRERLRASANAWLARGSAPS